MAFDKIVVTMGDALDKLLGLLKNIFYGRVEFHEGVCVAYDHVDKMIKTLHLFRHIVDLPYSYSHLYAFNVEISCSIQDLVRGPPVALSQIPSELSSFKTKMTGAIRNLIHTRLSPPSQVPTTPIMDGGLLVQMERDATTPPALALEDANRSKETSVEFHVGEAIDGESKAMKTTDKGSNTMDNKEGGPEVVNAYKSDPTSHDYYAPVSVTRSADLLKDQALGVFITTNIQLVVSSYVLPATKVFDLDDVIKLEHPIIVDALGQMFGYMSYFFHSAPMSNLLALWSSSGLLWFSTFSTVQKHEWEPPP